MIATANRLNLVSEYYFAAKLREIARMRQEGKPVLNLGIGSPDQPPHPDVVEALNDSAQSAAAHGYQSYTGLPALRTAWADWYARHYQCTLDPEHQILPLIGSKEGIAHIAFTFLEPGDVALIPNPGYPTYRAATLLAGAEARAYDLLESRSWQPDLEALEQTDLSRVKIMWINYPHMPTGATAAADTFRRLIDFGARNKILIVHDNPYSFILNKHPQSILAEKGAMEVALELNSLSKSHNMAGWRVGMLAGHAQYLQAVLRFKSNMDSGQFLPVQQAAIAALQAPNDWYDQLNETYGERQQEAFALLRQLGCSFDPNQQGMFVWARIPPQYADGYAMSDDLLQRQNLFITPGGIFGEAGRCYVRVSLCCPVTQFLEALQRIQQV